MSSTTTDRLYNLMPAVYRERDAEQGYPLRALLGIITEQADLVHADIERLWDNLFIETCQPWVIPYIGDLVGNNLLFDASRVAPLDTASKLLPDLLGTDLRPPVAARTRADVAKTIYYRRRKGTLPMLEELARDVTGLPAHAVEFFELLGWTQYREHIRPQSQWVNVRSVDRMDRIDGAFDESSHTVDVRAIAQQEGWHNIHNLGFFLWRLKSYPLKNVPARQASAAWRYHFSPLGNPAPLFTRWRREGDEAGLATEFHIPAPMRCAFFYEDLKRYQNLEPTRPDFTDLYGLFEPFSGSTLTPCPACSFFIVRNDVPVAATQNPTAPVSLFQPQIISMRLDPWPANPPTGRVIGVDVERGRLAIGDGWGDATDALDVFYHYGFSADLGGGPYERRKWLVRPDLAAKRYLIKEDGTAPATHTSVTAALADWSSGAVGRPNTIVTLLDSRTYQMPAAIQLRNEGWLVIEAANGERPVLQTANTGLEVQVSAPIVVGDPDRSAALTLSGVVVEGFIEVTGDLGELRLLHSTLVPGRQLKEDGNPNSTDASLVVRATGAIGAQINAQCKIELAFSVAGPIIAPDHAAGIWLLDSIVDGFDAMAISGGGTDAAPKLVTERATVLGAINVKSLEGSETIFNGHVESVRTQEGCVRFSYVPPHSHTPQRYRCQPDLAVANAIKEAEERNPNLTQAERDAIRQFVEGWLSPEFATTVYGQPAYAQLHLGCPREITTGAEDGSEIGAFCHLKMPQRESNLRIRLDEYLPFGLEAGIIYVT